ncbi:MAG: MASE3 domain-containing protein [Coriobacteriia bacterium]|nr:MASE3 domain-containing protein [Coriobacteriia bacterium]
MADEQTPERPAGSGVPLARSLALSAVGLLLAGAVLYAVSIYSFPVFHGLIELFAASTALAIFFVAWHSRRFLDNAYVGIVGVAYLGVAIIGVLHTLAYKGTNVFPGTSNDLATQLWLAARYVATLAFLVAPFFVNRRVDLRAPLLGFSALTAVLLAAIFRGAFPPVFVEGVGLTAFKIGVEYVVVVALMVAFVLLVRVRASFDQRVFLLLCCSIAMSVGAEMAFTLYADPFGPANLGGHFLYAGAAFLVYRALVHVALEDPYAVLFRRLKQREEDLQLANRLSEALTRIVSGIASTLDSQAILERVVVLAATTIGADAAAVSAPDDDAWVVRSVHKHPPDVIGTRLTAAQSAHIAAAVASREVLVVEDTSIPGIFSRQLAADYSIGALLTVPLTVRDEPIGALSFHFHRPHHFREIELDFARKLGSAVALAVENARLYETEHEVAETLQAGLRPQLEDVAGVEVGWSYEAAPGVGRLGGDFFDVFAIDGTRAAFMIGDVAGKGIKAATTTATVRGAARALAYVDSEPVTVLNGLNMTLARRGLDAGFVTLLYGTLDVVSGYMRLGIAGHPSPYLCDRREQPDYEHAIDPPLGLFPERTYHSVDVQLAKGERFIMYTDGLIDARSDGVPFGEEGVYRVLAEDTEMSVWELSSALAEAAAAHTGGNRVLDDVAVLAIRFVGR